MSDSEDIVTEQIVIDAQQAIQALESLVGETQSWEELITLVSGAVKNLSAQWGTSLGATISILKETDKELSKLNEDASIFGKVSTAGWKDVGIAVKDTATGLQGISGAIENTYEPIDTASNKINAMGIEYDDTAKQAEKTGEAGQAMGEKTAKGAEEATGGLDLVRMALGTIQAIIVFQLVQAVETAFSSMIKYAQDFSNALYQIGVAQDVLAKSGINIQQKDLLAIIKDVNAQFGVFSTVQMTDAVAKAALLTQNYKLTKEQIEGIVKAAADLSIQQGNLDNMQSNIEQITRSLASGSGSRALEQLGVYLTAAEVKAEAFKLGLVHGTEALSDQAKVIATYTLMQERLSKEQQDFGDYQATLPGQTDKLKASWADFLLLLGNAVAPALIKLIDAFQFGITILEVFFKLAYIGFGTMYIMITSVFDLLTGKVHGFNNMLDEMTQRVQQLGQSANQLFNLQGNGTPNPMSGNTPVGAPAPVTPDITSFENSIQTTYDAIDKLDTDFQTKQQQQLEDYNTNVQRTEEDYANQIAQVQQQENQKIADIQEKFRTQQKDAEEKFQLDLQKLREKYLFDLSDALRQRDALKVLQLMEKYNMDKQDMTDAFNLQQKQAKEQYKIELDDAKKAANDKIALLKQEEALKLQRMQEDYNTQKARETQQYNEQKAALQKQLDDKLHAEAQALADELGIQGAGVDLIYQLLVKYYGPDGLFDKLQDRSNASLVAKGNQMLAELAQLVSAYNSAISSIGGNGGAQGPTVSHPNSDNRRASGGIDIVNTPTLASFGATYGEAGPEAHIFIPLNSGGGSIPSGLNIGSGGSKLGKSTIEITLHPDLVGKIVATSLDATANVILKSARTRQ